MTAVEIERRAAEIPAEERPVASSKLSGLGDFLGIYGGEHIAATEFVIGALLVTWGVRAKELLLGLVVGNLLATCMYAFCTAPIAVDTRLSLFAYLRKATGPWFQRAYNAAWGVTSIFYAAAMTAIASTSLKEVFGLPVQLEWYPTSVGSVVLTLGLAAVTVFVAAYGFKGVARFSSICAPWMIVMFFCGAAVSLPALCRQTGFGEVGGVGDFLRLLETHVFTGKVPEGQPHLTWIHVAAFAWMCNLAYHAGLNDMSIFRYAKRRSYGWVGIYGMFVGHFFAWTCAGVMGATAAALIGKDLTQLDSGAVAGTVLGWMGLLAVVAAGWTTATPNIYRAALSFATFAPKASLRKLSFAVGAVIAVCACFPAMMRIDKLVNAVVLVLPSVGAICLAEHWLFPRIGLVRYWNLYRGRKVNPAALAAWLVSAAFVVAALHFGWMHPFFLFLPTFLIAAVAYVAFAALWGAGHPVPDDVRRDVDAVEARIAELSEQAAKAESQEAGSPKVQPGRRSVFFGMLAAAMLVALAICAIVSPDSFRNTAVACTALYFAFALAFRRRLTFGMAILACAAVALAFPSLFHEWGGVKLISLVVPAIQIIMFGMGTTLSLGDFLRVVKRPWAVATGVVLQFLIMPVIGFLLAKSFGFSGELAAGCVLVGSVAGGTASNVIAFLAKADVALSVAMTCCSTLLSPFLTPLAMKALAGCFVEIDAAKMMVEILKVVIMPIAAGCFFHWVFRGMFERHKAVCDRILSAISMTGICFTILVITAPSRDTFALAGISVIAAAIVHNTVGYASGYWLTRLVGRFAHLGEAEARTVAIEVGMQNGGMAAALAIGVLGSAVAALPANVFSIWMNFSGSVLAGFWSKRCSARQQEKE